MKTEKLEVLFLDLPLHGSLHRRLIQLREGIEGLPEEGPQLFEIRDTELNQFLPSPLNTFLEDILKNKYNPILEHLKREIGSVRFTEAKLVKKPERKS